MQRPRTITPKRPRTTCGKVARNNKEAAVHLVRLEFDLSRLEMGIAQAEGRLTTYRTEYDEKLRERAHLMERLNG